MDAPRVTGRQRGVILVLACLACAVALGGLSLFLRSQGLARADQWGSVLSLVLDVAAICVAVLGPVVGFRREGGAPRARRVVIRQRIQAQADSQVKAPRSQRVRLRGADVSQDIHGRTAGTVDASDAQHVSDT